MKLEEYKQFIEAQRLSSLALGLDALRKSSEIQKMSALSDIIKLQRNKGKKENE